MTPPSGKRNPARTDERLATLDAVLVDLLARRVAEALLTQCKNQPAEAEDA